MARYTNRQYRTHMLVLMAIYVALVVFVWPYAKHAESSALKTVLALAPSLPVVVVIWLMAKRVMASDEFEQRLHLMALSTATGVVAALSIIGGFLAASHVVELDGDVLIWVYPALCIVFGIAHLQLKRHYGTSGCE